MQCSLADHQKHNHAILSLGAFPTLPGFLTLRFFWNSLRHSIPLRSYRHRKWWKWHAELPFWWWFNRSWNTGPHSHIRALHRPKVGNMHTIHQHGERQQNSMPPQGLITATSLCRVAFQVSVMRGCGHRMRSDEVPWAGVSQLHTAGY